MQDAELIPVTCGGEYIEVHPSALQEHKRLGWAECERRAPEVGKPAKRARPAKAEPESKDE